MVTYEQLEAAEKIELEASDALKEARAVANALRVDFGTQELAELGISLDETICLAPEWGFSKRNSVRCIVTRVTSNGDALCRCVTKKNKVHEGRSAFSVPIGKITPEADT